MEFSFKTIIGLIFVVLGLSIIFNFNIGKYLFPAFLIILGISLLFGQYNQNGSGSQQSTLSSLDETAVFSSVNKKIETNEFKGGKVDVVFGGGEIDLRKAKIVKGETVDLEINAVFGGVKVIVPENWTVNSNVTGVFGGFENETTHPASGKEQGRLNLKGAAVFGGGSVTNK